MSKKYQFSCSHCRKAPRRGGFPRNYQWKTERGFKNHKCYIDDEKRRLIANDKRIADDAEALRLAIENSAHKVGESVHCWGYIVTKPTHRHNGYREVRVRYEEERKYFAHSGTITAITVRGYIVGSRPISKFNICESKEAAESKAETEQHGYNEACKFASRCR